MALSQVRRVEKDRMATFSSGHLTRVDHAYFSLTIHFRLAMGVDDVLTRPRMASASAGEMMPAMSIKTQQQIAMEETESDLLDGGRRRTSIPPSFAYGSDEGATPPGVEERRWRSFDWTSSMASAKTSISLGVLSLRIDHEHEEMRQCKARLRPRRRSALLHSVASFFSTAKKEQIHLRHMQMVADVAKRNRSLAILNDMRTMVLTMDDESVSSPTSSTLTSSTCGDQTPRGSHSESSIQRLLDGMANADQVLAEDSLHHILELQSHCLERLVEMHADKTNNVSKERGTSSSVALQQFLAEFVGPDGTRRVPCTLDIPTVALVRFEKLLTRYRVLKPQVKESLDQLCRDTMKSFVRPGHEVEDAAKIWQSREPRDVMQSLIRELFDSIIAEAWVAETYHSILRAFVEQMVFSRLAGACYRNVSEELDDKNTLWRSQVVKARALDLEGVGLPVEIPQVVMDRVDLFAKSVEAFNQIPHLVPSCVLGVFLGAIRVLYTEANELLGLECGCVSADVLLPLLVYVLSRCDLPHLHSQVFLMENYAIETSQEGSEAAYYLACLQAAIGYIMTEVGKKNYTEA